MKRREAMVKCILDSIVEANKGGKPVIKDFLVAEVCMKFYCGERLVHEILKHLDKLGKIKRYGYEIWTPENYETYKILEKDMAIQEQLKDEVEE